MDSDHHVVEAFAAHADSLVWGTDAALVSTVILGERYDIDNISGKLRASV